MFEVDKEYCMSSFLMYRTVIDEKKCFKEGVFPRKAIVKADDQRKEIHNSDELYLSLKTQIEKIVKKKKVALCLSGGIDSAILAKFLPRGTTAYTFKCIVPGMQVIDETPMASRYAELCGLNHKIIEIYWEDFENYKTILMEYKGAPIHSIEVQIYKAAMQAKADGFDALLFGESSDVLYGGMSQLLSRDWTLGEFVDRYTYVRPYYVLKKPLLITSPYIQYLKDGWIDVHGFNSHVFFREGLGSYQNACEAAQVECCAPFSNTILNNPLDYKRVRQGENKYLVREIFQQLYPDLTVPPKTPMPRPMNEWFKTWQGPMREEFWPHCIENMNGDQKWLVYILESFLNLLDEEK